MDIATLSLVVAIFSTILLISIIDFLLEEDYKKTDGDKQYEHTIHDK